MAAKGLAWAAGKPFIAVNHLEAHALAARLSPGVEFPYLLLLVSGGHYPAAGLRRGRALSPPRHDAATTPPARPSTRPQSCWGSAIPGGPAIERAARGGDPAPVRPAAAVEGAGGLRFLVFRAEDGGAPHRRRHERGRPLGPQDVADLAAAVELAICDALIDRTANAIAWFRRHHPEGTSLVAAGGVAANQRLRAAARGAGRSRRASTLSRRRRRCAPTTAR